LQIFETLLGSLKDENKFKKKEPGQVFQNILLPEPNGSQKKKLENRQTLVGNHQIQAHWQRACRGFII
jgi:hypothetical protein